MTMGDASHAERRFAIEPLNPVGAELSSLTDVELNADVAVILHGDWLEYGILLFRDVASVQKRLALSRCFGTLQVHPLLELRAKEDPHFFPIGGAGMHAMPAVRMGARASGNIWPTLHLHKSN